MMKAIVVEGHTETRRALVEVLSRLEGVAVLCSIPDLETAARVLSQFTPDLLVMGTELADGDGLELLAWVRRSGMTIVVVGPAVSREVWRRYLAAGADRFVEPDPELEELQDIVRALVGRQAPAPPPADRRGGDGRDAAGIVQDFNNQIHAIEQLLEILERSPDDKQLWTEARVTLDRAVSLTALLLGHVRGHRPRAPSQD